MLNRASVLRLVGDIFRFELTQSQTDSLAMFDENIQALWATLPEEIRPVCDQKLAEMFGFMPRCFSSLERLVDYSYASFLKNQQLVFTTSGPTGDPIPRVYTVNMMWEEARTLAPLFQGVKRVVSLVPAARMYGFDLTVLLPLYLQVPVVTLPPIASQAWPELIQPGDLIVGFPLFWQQWLSLGFSFPAHVQVVSSAEACPEETVAGLYAAGAETFTDVYGSSQTGMVAFRREANAPFEILPSWDISLREKEPLFKHTTGNTWLQLPDHVQLQNERMFTLLDRRDGAVRIAGEKVYPKRVENELTTHPAVKMCRVRKMRPEEGQRLKAFLVLNEGYGPENLEMIRSFLVSRLGAHEIPRTFTFGEMLPTGMNGKETDW